MRLGCACIAYPSNADGASALCGARVATGPFVATEEPRSYWVSRCSTSADWQLWGACRGCRRAVRAVSRRGVRRAQIEVIEQARSGEFWPAPSVAVSCRRLGWTSLRKFSPGDAFQASG